MSRGDINGVSGSASVYAGNNGGIVAERIMLPAAAPGPGTERLQRGLPQLPAGIATPPGPMANTAAGSLHASPRNPSEAALALLPVCTAWCACLSVILGVLHLFVPLLFYSHAPGPHLIRPPLAQGSPRDLRAEPVLAVLPVQSKKTGKKRQVRTIAGLTSL
jgi:hypothetical protein